METFRFGEAHISRFTSHFYEKEVWITMKPSDVTPLGRQETLGGLARGLLVLSLCVRNRFHLHVSLARSNE